MGLMDAIKESPTVEIKSSTLYCLLNQSARLEYLERALNTNIKRRDIKHIFKIQEESNGNIE